VRIFKEELLMSIKKKMGMGILAGALGVSLIGGGTWAAFNDVETTSNNFYAGTLDLQVGAATTFNFNISNLKPGDYFTKQLVLSNGGSLNINDILVHANKLSGFTNKDEIGLETKIGTNAGLNTEDDFLSQFNVVIKKSNNTVVYNGSLANLVNAPVDELTGTDANIIGLAAGATETFDITVTFVKDNTLFPNSRLHQQNKYQGEQSNLQFVFEATQMPGEDRSN
jgi:spore coat-associated protein N